MKVVVQLNHYDLRVMIDGLVHVYIPRKQFNGFHSWADDSAMWVIEYRLKNGDRIKTEFDSKEKWQKILKELNDKL